MASRAILGRRFVEHHGLGIYDSGELVALRAGHPLVRATERKRRPLLMVEQRRLPPRAVVALGTACDLARGKLLPVDVLVAVFALRGSCLEIHVN